MANLIGKVTNQIPVTGDLGTMAFQDAAAPTFGSLISIDSNISNVRPSILFDFVNGRFADTRLRCVRSTWATAHTPDGILNTIQHNTPRIDYDPSTGECKGLLVEEQRTNLITQSISFAGSYSTFDCTAGASSVRTPAGGTSGAVTLTENSSNISNPRKEISQSVVSGTWYSFSAFFKQEGITYARIFTFTDNGAFNGTSLHVSLLDGSVVYQSSNVYSVTVQKYPDGWWRVGYSTNATASANSYIGIGGSRNPTASLYAGDGSSKLHIWGMQWEAGNAPSSFIQTNGSNVTRNADYVYVDYTSLPNIQRFTGTAYCDAVSYVDPSSNAAPTRTLWSFTDTLTGANAEHGFRYAANSSSCNGYTYADSNYITSQAGSSTPQKSAFAWDVNDVAIYGDGTPLSNNPTRVTSKSLAGKYKYGILYLGNDWPTSNGYYLQGWIRKFAYFAPRLPNQELAEMTR